MRRFDFTFIVGTLLLLQGCSSAPIEMTESKPAPKAHLPTRDEVMGPNRAQTSVKPKTPQEYLFRNVASAFPDTGKNMMVKDDRALPKATVTGALDQSPWHQRVYLDPQKTKENLARFSSVNRSFYSTPLTQREALILAQTPKKETADPYFQTESNTQDDAFEPNNDQQNATDISDAEDRWLALLGPKDSPTEGVQRDEDWYKIQVSPQYRRLMLDLRFQHYLGDIDLKLYNEKGTLLAASQGGREDEFIHLILEKGGTYFVQITGSNRGNRYDFKYSTYFTGGGDDEYEDNDTLKTAFDLKAQENMWLSEVQGEGIAADNDFFSIKVPAGRERLKIDLRYDVAKGDVDVRLLNAQGQMIASSANIGDDDFIDFTVPRAGVYYLKIYPFSPTKSFNMYDLKWSTEKVSQKETAKTSTKNPSLPREATR